MHQKLSKLPYIVCYLCAVVVGIKQLREPDIWWQLLSGRWMLENNAITRTDMLSYTVEGTQWINVKWLYEVLAASLERGLGPHAVMLLQIIVNVLIVYLLIRVLKKFTEHINAHTSTFFTVTSVIALLAVSEFRMAGRPEMISHLMTALYMFIIWAAPNFSWKRLVWLVPLQCIWANMHEGYPVGMVIIGLYVAGTLIAYLKDKSTEHLQAVKQSSLIMAGAAIAILINPNTITLWTQPFEIFRQLKANQYTTELFSFTEVEYWTFQAKVHVTMLSAVLLFWAYRLFVDKKEFKLTPKLIGYLLSIPLFGYLSLSANRNIPFAQIVMFPSVPVICVWLIETLKIQQKKWYQQVSKRTVFVSIALAAIFYTSIASNAYYKYTDSPNRYGIHITTLHNATSAADFIRTHNIKGPAFSDYFVSSYLLWDLYPQFKSYIDLRDLDIFNEDFFQEYIDLYGNPKKFYEKDSIYKFNYIVLSTSQLRSLQQTLYWEQGFNVVYVDPVAVIFLRESEENDALNKNVAAQKLFTWPQQSSDPGWAEGITKLFNPAVEYTEEQERFAPLYAGLFYNSVRNTKMAVRLLQPAVEGALSNDAKALSTLGYSFLEYQQFAKSDKESERKIDSAFFLFDRALEIDPNLTSAHIGIASFFIIRNNYRDAKAHLETSIKLDSKNDFAHYLYGLACRSLWQTSKSEQELENVISGMENALEINDANVKAYLYLAEAYWHKGEKETSREYMRKAINSKTYWVAQEKELLKTMQGLTGVQ